MEMLNNTIPNITLPAEVAVPYIATVNTEYLIAAVVIAVVIVVFSLISGFIVNKRVYYASRFGQLEHHCGRLMGWLLIATFFVEYLKFGYTIVWIIITFIIWVTYLLSHTLEKAFYGHCGPRG